MMDKPVLSAGPSEIQCTDIDVDKIIEQLLSVKETPGKQVRYH